MQQSSGSSVLIRIVLGRHWPPAICNLQLLLGAKLDRHLLSQQEDA